MDAEIFKEEGELSDSDGIVCDEEPYNPISRPSYEINRAREVRPAVVSSDEEETSDSESYSDSDSEVANKRRKTCPVPVLYNRNSNMLSSDPSAKKKNNIWANVLQEDELLSEIGGVKFKKINSDRNVESYDYSLALNEHQKESSEVPQEFVELEEDLIRKEKRKERFYLSRQDSNDSLKEGDAGHSHKKSKPRILRKLELKDDLTDEEIGFEIATALFEQKPELIIKVVEVLGREKALELYFETRKVEKNGGKMTINGSRRRTSGGVFLYILRTSSGVEKSQLAQIFCDEKASQQSQLNRKRKRNKQRRNRTNNNEEAMETADGEAMNLQSLFSPEESGGTKCPGSTPVSSPTHSDKEDFDLSPHPRSRLNSAALPMKEVCEKAAYEISVREKAEKGSGVENPSSTSYGSVSRQENMDTTC